MALNNADFQKLLHSSDAQLMRDLTKGPRNRNRNKKKQPEKRKPQRDEGDEEGDDPVPKKRKPWKPQKAETEDAPAENYRDRATERRKGIGEYETVEHEWDQMENMTVEESKYLGGDMDHTHMVKGLDFALLSKVRTEMDRRTRHDQMRQRAREKKQASKTTSKEFGTLMGRQIYASAISVLHPNHKLYRERLDHLHALLCRGHKVKGNRIQTFIPGRMCYEFGLDDSSQELPTVVFFPQDEKMRPGANHQVAPVSLKSCARIKELFEDAVARRRQRREDRKAGKVPDDRRKIDMVRVDKPKGPKAKDDDVDIFGDVGKFNAADLEGAKGSKDKAPLRDTKAVKSFFDDAGRAPDLDGREEKPEFRPAKKFEGTKKGWVFKKGAEGLGYYRDGDSGDDHRRANKGRDREREERERKRREAEEAAERARREQAKKEQAKKIAAKMMASSGMDGYDECFPNVEFFKHKTSDWADEDKKNKKGKGKGKGKNFDPESQPKKGKMTEEQQWEKIEGMMEKRHKGERGGGRSLNQMENMSHKGGRGNYF